MLYSNHKNTQDKIVEILSSKKLGAKELHQLLNTDASPYSLQAIYNALKTLIEAGAVIKHKDVFFVSDEWRKVVIRSLNTVPEEPLLQPGESKRYIFKTTRQLDSFWKHTSSYLFAKYPGEPVFFFEPHEFWIHNPIQYESQLRFLKHFKQESRSAYMLIGAQNPLDTAYRETYKSYLSIHLDEKTSYTRNTFITVLNNFVITTKLPAGLAESIDELYLLHDEPRLFQSALIPLLEQDIKLSVTIENNRESAVRYRKRIAKDLYVPSHEREKFTLF